MPGTQRVDTITECVVQGLEQVGVGGEDEKIPRVAGELVEVGDRRPFGTAGAAGRE